MKTLTLSRGISQDGHTLMITDKTTTYDTDLPARDSLALIDYTTFQKSGQDEQVIAAASYSPLDVVTFSYDVEEQDGIYYTYVFAIPIYEAGPLEDGTIVYDVNDGKVKKMIDSTLTEITVASLIDEDVDYGQINSKVITELKKIEDELTLVVTDLQAKAIDHICEMDEYHAAQFKRDYVTNLLYYAHVKFCTGEYVTAQQAIDTGLDFGQKAIDEYTEID